MPTPRDFVPVTIRGACSSLPCELGPLAPGEVREVIATLAPPPDYAGPSTLIVIALALSEPFDPRPENNRASVVTTITELADLSITKTGPTTAVPGQQVTYALTVANTGPSAATGVTVDDPIPAGLTFVSTSGDCTTSFPCALGQCRLVPREPSPQPTPSRTELRLLRKLPTRRPSSGGSVTRTRPTTAQRSVRGSASGRGAMSTATASTRSSRGLGEAAGRTYSSEVSRAVSSRL